jgi:hypothetical protein
LEIDVAAETIASFDDNDSCPNASTGCATSFPLAFADFDLLPPSRAGSPNVSPAFASKASIFCV